MSSFRDLCTGPAGRAEVLQGNIAFAAGVVRAGIPSADGYPGTPSSEVIHRGLSQVQDLITVGWSVNEAVAAGVGLGHTLAGDDCVVTMKIPGLYQAGDIFTSAALFTRERGALIYYVASDFTPSSTQHTIDPHYLFKSCFVPVLEPRDHQELHQAAAIAVELGREHNTQVVVLTSGLLCHSEGLIRLMEPQTRPRVEMPADLKPYNCLPPLTRANYDLVMAKRMPALREMVESSPLNRWTKGSGKRGVITYGSNAMYLDEVKELFYPDLDVLSLAFTNPLPLDLIHRFHESINGEVFVIEDGYRYLQGELAAAGLPTIGKEEYSKITEWSPALIAKLLGRKFEAETPRTRAASAQPVPRPPMICAGCPYRLFGEEVGRMKKKGQIAATFGDIGCNSLLYFMNAMDTGVAMGASESKRTGFVLSRPEMASQTLSILGDGTECHSGMDATRNAVFRHMAGVKVILDNEWTAMTGGQPGPTSPVNLAGQPRRMSLVDSLKAHGAEVKEVSGYDRKGLQKALKDSLAAADEGLFTCLVVQGTCIRKVPKSSYGQKLTVDLETCKKCGMCDICPGIAITPEGFPEFTNLCTGCVSQTPACLQMCPTGSIKIAETPSGPDQAKPAVDLPPIPDKIELPELGREDLPGRLALAIRGVGGQGNLFFGRVLTQLAFLAGYGESNVIKGETHGMAQMGGPVISTFACGAAHSPTLLPGSADCLVSMESSEVLRPGFLEMLKQGGAVLLARTAILPQGLAPESYPDHGVIMDQLAGFKVMELDVLGRALGLGDAEGRSANVVMIGALSRTAPFDKFPEEYWLEAIRLNSPTPAMWQANRAAFKAGRDMV